MELIAGGGLGDWLSATAVVRELKRAYPEENVRLWHPRRPEIFKWNPYLGHGNRECGKRVALRWDYWADEAIEKAPDGTLARYFGAKVAREAGMPFEMKSDRPELFFSPQEKRAPFDFEIPEKSVAIDPWASWGTRRWPHRSFAELAYRLAADGWTVFEIGGGRRRDEPPLSSSRDCFGLFEVRRSAILLSMMRLYIGNDTGTMHLAAAVGIPQVVAFGVVPAGKRAYSDTIAVSPPSACAARCSRICRRDTFCMSEITVDQMMEAVRGI